MNDSENESDAKPPEIGRTLITVAFVLIFIHALILIIAMPKLRDFLREHDVGELPGPTIWLFTVSRYFPIPLLASLGLAGTCQFKKQCTLLVILNIALIAAFLFEAIASFMPLIAIDNGHHGKG